MTEVKSSASVKPYHIDDCAIQAWVLKQNNIALSSIELAHINTGFEYQGDGVGFNLKVNLTILTHQIKSKNWRPYGVN